MNVSWTRESLFKQDSDFISRQTKMMFKNIIGLSNNQIIRKFAPLSIKIAEDLEDDIKINELTHNDNNFIFLIQLAFYFVS
jgi:hypothetical protein